MATLMTSYIFLESPFIVSVNSEIFLNDNFLILSFKMAGKFKCSSDPSHFISEVNKLGCVVRMVVGSILPYAECGSNDHRKDAPPFIRKSRIRNRTTINLNDSPIDFESI